MSEYVNNPASEALDDEEFHSASSNNLTDEMDSQERSKSAGGSRERGSSEFPEPSSNIELLAASYRRQERSCGKQPGPGVSNLGVGLRLEESERQMLLLL